MSNLQEEIRSAINRNCAENESGTPDYILAQYLMACLAAYNATTVARDQWYGLTPEPPR